jgi:perosamine synthetase
MHQLCTRIPLYMAYTPPGLSTVVSNVFDTGQLATGPNVERFEQLLGEYLENPLVTTTSDISAALTLCLFQAGVRPGDDVLVSPLVCLSSTCPIRNLFANVRWCDVDPLTGNLDPSEVARKITPRTKALIVFHWAGNPADMDTIHSIAREYNLPVIEDAGEALGADYNGKKIGSTGSDYTVFSFYPNRHLTTIDGGAIACAHDKDYQAIRRLKRYGIHQPSFRDPDGEIDPGSDIPVAGWNGYMSHVAATVGIAQMLHLPSIVARHQENGLYYDEVFAALPGISVLKRPPRSRSAYWVYTFLAEQRDELFQRLREQRVHGSKVHLRNDGYTCFGGDKTPLPGVDHFAAHCISIPSGWWVSQSDRTRIADVIRQHLL